MRRPLLIGALLLHLSGNGEVQPLFSPPKAWKLVTQKNKEHSRVKIGFVGEATRGFSPSINVATEEIGDTTLTEYLKAAKAIYEKTPHNRWRQLGKIQTASGESTLTEIDTRTEWGDVRLMQMIFIKDRKAYIMTAASLREDFGQHLKEFQTAFQSLSLIDSP